MKTTFLKLEFQWGTYEESDRENQTKAAQAEEEITQLSEIIGEMGYKIIPRYSIVKKTGKKLIFKKEE